MGFIINAAKKVGSFFSNDIPEFFGNAYEAVKNFLVGQKPEQAEKPNIYNDTKDLIDAFNRSLVEVYRESVTYTRMYENHDLRVNRNPLRLKEKMRETVLKAGK